MSCCRPFAQLSEARFTSLKACERPCYDATYWEAIRSSCRSLEREKGGWAGSFDLWQRKNKETRCLRRILSQPTILSKARPAIHKRTCPDGYKSRNSSRRC